jgi:5-keto-L-gluconate epimerase
MPPEDKTMKYSYVLPDPGSYTSWVEFDADLACMKQSGYDAVELQIPDPAELDEPQLRKSLDKVRFSLCAFQTGSTYTTRGNCLAKSDPAIRQRTIDLLKSFVDLASRFNSVIVFGSLQGRACDEPDLAAGRKRIVETMTVIGEYATRKNVTLAFEPVNHLEVAHHHTIDSVARLVRSINQPGLKMMIDSFHMNIEEKDILAPLPAIKDIIAHVHLSETNRDILGRGHWNTAAFLNELQKIDYTGYCSIGVYNTNSSRKECIQQCIKQCHGV